MSDPTPLPTCTVTVPHEPHTTLLAAGGELVCGGVRGPTMPDIPAEAVAQRFHEAYERLAPDFGYRTREASAKPWDEVPEQNRALMIAVCAELLPHLREQWLAEVEGALRDVPRYLAWLRAKGVWDADSADAADYLRDVLGAGAAGEGGDGS